MAFASHADFRPPSSRLSVDPRPATCPDGFDALDDCILGAGIMSPASAHRRESFADSNAAMFSPQGSVWNEFPLSVPSNPFYDQDNNPFNRLDAAQAAAYGQQPSAWPLFDRSSGSCTPAVNSVSPTYDHVGPDFDSGRSSSRARVGANAPPAYGRLPLQNNLPPSSVFSPARAISIPAPLSPHNNKEWMTLAAQEAESRPLSKRMRPNAPPRNYSPFSRRDGIRKKNARFEIPAERSLINIDHLIAHSTNDDEIKELKQQKRLLRNRQAAYDSLRRVRPSGPPRLVRRARFHLLTTFAVLTPGNGRRSTPRTWKRRRSCGRSDSPRLKTSSTACGFRSTPTCTRGRSGIELGYTPRR